MRKASILLAVLLLVPAVMAQADLGLSMDGRYWDTFSQPQKIGFMFGFYEGVTVSTTSLSSQQLIDCAIDRTELIRKEFIFGLTLTEIAAEVDTFYREGANAPILVKDVILYVGRKAKGATPKELAEYAAMLRKQASQMREMYLKMKK